MPTIFEVIEMFADNFSKRPLKYGVLLFLVSIVVYVGASYWRSKRFTNNSFRRLLKDDVFTSNNKYPLTDPLKFPDMMKYKIAAVADLDKDRSKSPDKPFEWHSFIKTGYLTIYNNGGYKVEFIKTETLTTHLNEKGRGLELSELCMFNEKLYSVDDRTGVVYQIVNNEPIPWVILQDGDGINKKGFKSEWMTVKDNMLYVGSVGKERTTTTGDFLNLNPMFVKSITAGGQVTHHNWTDHYISIRAKLGIKDPGYVIHEAVTWSHEKKRWFFLPRRMSAQKYDDELDEKRGTNVLISALSDFTEMNVIYVGDLDITHGFSSFKFIPGTHDNIVIALKTKEVGNDVSSYVTIFDVNTGKIIMHEQLLDNNKYEGVEFL